MKPSSIRIAHYMHGLGCSSVCTCVGYASLWSRVLEWMSKETKTQYCICIIVLAWRDNFSWAHFKPVWTNKHPIFTERSRIDDVCTKTLHFFQWETKQSLFNFPVRCISRYIITIIHFKLLLLHLHNEVQEKQLGILKTIVNIIRQSPLTEHK